LQDSGNIHSTTEIITIDVQDKPDLDPEWTSNIPRVFDVQEDLAVVS
jgi:hypothetical protein